ncbi:MAG: septal ring lytic transglycosylase RlpA family protein [Acidiferrobacteraceae bacterium]
MAANNPLIRLWPAAVLALLAACSSVPSHGYYRNDGPLGAVNTTKLHNAVPRPVTLSRVGNAPYTVFGIHYYPLASACGYRARGIASWYGRRFYKHLTSDGERYNMFAMTAASKVLPLPSFVRVTDLQNGRSVVVRVNDRGPFLDNRLIDLSYAAAAKLDMIGRGTAPVEVVDVDVDCRPQGDLIQVGSFRSPADAARLSRHLVHLGFATVRVNHVQVHGVRWYAVRVGPFPDTMLRERAIDRLRQSHLPALTVVAAH